MPATAHSPTKIEDWVLEALGREDAIHGLKARLLFELQLASQFLIVRRPTRDIRSCLKEIGELADSIEAIENGAPL